MPVAGRCRIALTLLWIGSLVACSGDGPPPLDCELPAPAPVTTYQTAMTVAGADSADPVDVYVPSSASADAPVPVALMLQGGRVDKSEYATFARAVASFSLAACVAAYDAAYGELAGAA